MDLRDQLHYPLGPSYRLQRELGQGGMSTVYLAGDLKPDRKVAVKVPLGPDRFPREIRIAARPQHPHILPLLDSSYAQGFLYNVIPYVEGQSLRDRLGRDCELPVHEAVRLLVEITDALTFGRGAPPAHESTIYFALLRPEGDVWTAEMSAQ